MIEKKVEESLQKRELKFARNIYVKLTPIYEDLLDNYTPKQSSEIKTIDDAINPLIKLLNEM